MFNKIKSTFGDEDEQLLKRDNDPKNRKKHTMDWVEKRKRKRAGLPEKEEKSSPSSWLWNKKEKKHTPLTLADIKNLERDYEAGCCNQLRWHKSGAETTGACCFGTCGCVVVILVILFAFLIIVTLAIIMFGIRNDGAFKL